ncbi:MAG: methyltransferase [Chitinophagales bacterium]
MGSFQFKRFTVQQEKAAMRVGTDGVLLGAWAAGASCDTILDIGTGTGLIALMLAQRFSQAQIDAIDIDPGAVADATINFSASPWGKRLKVAEYDAAKLVGRGKKYDLLVCNPPFYAEGPATTNVSRDLARDARHLPHTLLLDMLIGNGTEAASLCVILPVKEGMDMLVESVRRGLYCRRRTSVSSHTGEAAIRLMLEFCILPCSCAIDQLVIGGATVESFSEACKELTRDFYLALK